MEYKYNMKSPAVKRLMREAQELNEPSEEYYAQPVEENLFEWHFTVRGPPDSEFDGGIYHGRIILPPEYPMKPPSIILLTPNGRFEVNKKICLSISGYHPESWQPSWSIRTALLAIIGFMPTQGLGAIGSLDYTADERKALAHGSHDWVCPLCGPIRDSLMKLQNTPRQVNEEARDLASRISFKGEVERADKNQDVSVCNEPSNESWRSLENANADASYDSNVRNRLESSIRAVSEVNESLTDTSQVHQRKPQVVLQNKETTSSRETTIQSSTSVSTIIVILLVCAIIGLMFQKTIYIIIPKLHRFKAFTNNGAFLQITCTLCKKNQELIFKVSL